MLFMSTLLCRKGDDPLSPVYTPSILFSFTLSPKKRRAEQGLERYEVSKRRREDKDITSYSVEFTASETDVVFVPQC